MAGVSEQYQLAVGRARARAMQSTDLAFRIRSMQEQDRERQNRDDLDGMEWLSKELGDLQWRKTATPEQVNRHLSQVNALRQSLGGRNNMDLGKLNEAPDVFTNSLNGFMAKAQQEAQRLSFLTPEQRQTWLRVKAAEARQLLGDQGYYAATHHAATSLSLQQYAAQAQTPPAQPGAQVPAQQQLGEPQKAEVDRMAVPAGAPTAPKGLGELPIPVGDDFVMSAISPYLPDQVLPDALRGLYNDITNRVMEGKATPADLALYGDIVQEIQGGAKTPERAKGIVDTLLSSAAAYQGEKQGDEVGQLLTDADVAMSDPATAAKYKGMPRGTAWEQHLLALAKARGITLSYQESQTIHQDALRLNAEEAAGRREEAAAAKEQDRLRHQSLMENVNLKQLNISLAHLGIAQRAAAGKKAAKTTVEEYVDTFWGNPESYRGPAGMVSFMAKKGESQAKIAQTLRAMKGLPPDAWLTFTLDDMRRRPDLYGKMGYGLTEADAFRKWDGDLDLALEFVYRRGRPKTTEAEVAAELVATIKAKGAKAKAK